MKKYDFNQDWFCRSLTRGGEAYPVAIPHDAMRTEARVETCCINIFFASDRPEDGIRGGTCRIGVTGKKRRKWTIPGWPSPRKAAALTAEANGTRGLLRTGGKTISISEGRTVVTQIKSI